MRYIKKFEKKDKGEEIIYTLNTKAISGTNVKYNVNITNSKYNEKQILSIENTPGSWYIETLLNGNASTTNELSIQGYDWMIYNWKDIRNELIEILPYLEIIKDTKKYNL